MNKEQIKVLICDDDPTFSKLICTFLSKESGIKIVGAASNKEQLIQLVSSTYVDVLLLDMNLCGNDCDGIVSAMDIHYSHPEIKIIILSSLSEDHLIQEAIAYGKVTNYITKEHYKDIPSAIREAFHNQSNIHHSTAKSILKQVIELDSHSLRSKISSKQIEILKLLDLGYSRKQIAEMLHYNEQTINNEICKVSSILRGKFLYLEWLKIKKHNIQEVLLLAKKIQII